MLPFSISESEWELCTFLWGDQAFIQKIKQGWEPTTQASENGLLVLARLKQLQFQQVIEVFPNTPELNYYQVNWLGHWLVFEVRRPLTGQVKAGTMKISKPAHILAKLNHQIIPQIKCSTIRLKIEQKTLEELLGSVQKKFQRWEIDCGTNQHPILKPSVRQGTLKKMAGKFVLLSAGYIRFFIYSSHVQ